MSCCLVSKFLYMYPISKHFPKHTPLCNAQITICFTSEDEKELANLLVNFCQSGFSLSKNKLHRLAWEYAYMNGITGFSARKEKAGHNWLKGFLGATPAEAKKGKNISVNRVMWCHPYYNCVSSLHNITKSVRNLTSYHQCTSGIVMKVVYKMYKRGGGDRCSWGKGTVPRPL